MQVAKVNDFADDVMFSTVGRGPECEVDGALLPVNAVGKCLGYWWARDLTASKSVEENIRNARRTISHYGCLAFQGDLNPLSTGSIIQTCVMPVLMYGSEN